MERLTVFQRVIVWFFALVIGLFIALVGYGELQRNVVCDRDVFAVECFNEGDMRASEYRHRRCIVDPYRGECGRWR